ncbi:meckelin-like [Antennarius striatus]|uniref:meckelin-like n=1 Tax=Antennarius striatus TaxID=241820 RepID=UPI0035AE520E
MATRTLLPGFQLCTICLTVYLLIFINSFNCEQFLISFKAPSDCINEEFFDISSLSCVKCGQNQRRSTTGLSCLCKTGYQTLMTEKAAITCQQCPRHKPAVTKDGFGCIRCPRGLSDKGTCQCPTGNVVVERDVHGNLLDEARCEKCNGSFPALSVPNSSGDRCETCQATFFNNSCKCNPPKFQAGGLCLPPNSLPKTVNPTINYPQLMFSLQSAWFTENLYSSSAACLVLSNLTACQALGNMCVMNMHSFRSFSTDACGLFNTIFRSRPAFSSTQDIYYWRTNLPWLYYGDEPGLASRVLQTEPVPLGFYFRGPKKNTNIKLLAAVYNVQGEFLRWEQVGGGNLQLCPETAIKQAAAFSFGTAYQQSCDLAVAELLSSHPEPLFYDVFMDLGGKEKRQLLPLPTLVYNQQYNGWFINQGSMMNWYLTRRMFVVDTLSGRERSMNSPPKVIRVATSIKIRFQLVPQAQEGKVFPPLMTVTYEDVPVTDMKTQTVSATFAVEYKMDQSDTRTMTNTALGVMGGLAVLCSLLKTVSWKRRIGSPLIDVETMLKFLLFFAGDIANVFFIVTVGSGLYWLILFKAQMFAAVLPPLPSQENQFVTLIACAFVLKAIQFLHKLVLQVSVDIFFIDWERPRSSGNRTMPVCDDSKQQNKYPSVTIWRTYVVANEWNKMQTIRKISPTFQVMAVLFCLEVLGFSNLALRDPWPNLQRSSHAYTPSYSRILRYGLTATLWLCIGLLQVIFFTVFHKQSGEDKFHQFVDLCSVSNISVLLLSHRCFGYYIHGRSVHGFADTNMEEMNNNLKREAESLCPQRGLLHNTDMQTFQVSLTNCLASHRERRQLNRRHGLSMLVNGNSTHQFEQKIKAYYAMNYFLQSMLDRAHPEMEYIVKDKMMIERIIGMEFLEPSDSSIFYNDKDHSFSNVLFYGMEATMLIFDTLFFCIADLGSQSFVLAAVLTYLQQMIFRLIRDTLGRKNLASKSLLDEIFLI